MNVRVRRAPSPSRLLTPTPSPPPGPTSFSPPYEGQVRVRARPYAHPMRACSDLGLVRRLGWLTETVHAVVYFAPEPRVAYEQLGLRGFWRGYFAGRCAALGPVGPDLAAAVLGGFAPTMVARAIPEVWQIATPAEVLTARTRAATAALGRLLPPDSADQVVTAAELTNRCIKALDVPGRPMAAAHRQVARPADPLGALWHDVTVLREHRGDGHLIALAAAGLVWPEPHLLIVDRLDPAQQAHRGWTDEQWTVAASRIHHHDLAAIDDATDRLAAAAYDILTPQERAALATALLPLAAAAAAQLPYPNAMGLPDVTRNAGPPRATLGSPPDSTS